MKPETKKVIQKEVSEINAQIDAAKRDLDVAEAQYDAAKEKLRDLQRRKDDLNDDLSTP